jgi:hypothetical protein
MVKLVLLAATLFFSSVLGSSIPRLCSYVYAGKYFVASSVLIKVSTLTPHHSSGSRESLGRGSPR